MEAFGGCEFGIAFDGEGDGFGESVRELVLGFLEGGHIFLGEVAGIDFDGIGLSAGVDDGFEGAFFVVGGTFDGVDELWN